MGLAATGGSSGFSAKNARVQLGTVNLAATKWMVNVKVDELDITNFETNAGLVNVQATNLFADYTSGICEAEFSVECIYDAQTPPDGIPPHIVPGTVGSGNVGSDPNSTSVPLGALRLFLSRSAVNLFWFFPNYVILTASNDAELRGIVKYSFTGKSKGAFAAPSGGGVTPILP